MKSIFCLHLFIKSANYIPSGQLKYTFYEITFDYPRMVIKFSDSVNPNNYSFRYNSQLIRVSLTISAVLVVTYRERIPFN